MSEEDVLVIKDRITKDEEPLSDVKDFVLKEGVNKYDPITFILPKTELNEHAYPLVDNENFILWDGHEYRIKGMYETLKGQTPIKYITNARHRFYDLLDVFRDTTLTNGYKSINQVLSFIFNGTRWNFTVIDPFDTELFDNFGNANCLDLFNKVIERYEAEFEIIGTEIRISKPQGAYIDMQFRYNHNVKTFKKNIDTSNLSTRIRGTGKLNEDGSPIVEALYISPNAHLYLDDNGNVEYKDAPPYSNETIQSEETLVKYLKANIQDVPDVYFELDFTVLKDAGYTKPIPEKGDVVPTILEQINVDVDLRIMEITRNPLKKNQSPKVTLANYKKTFANQLIDYQKSLLDKIWDENSKKIRYNVYDEAVKRATEALNNSLTELEYPPGMGILSRDPDDPNAFTALRSKGLGITTDGGITFPNAITPYGINTALLIAGQIKTNNIQIIGNDDLFYWDGNALMAINSADPNKFVRLNSDGQYIAKGAMTIERPDGALFMQDGLMRNDFSLQSHNPPFRRDGEYSIVDYWFRTPRDYYVSLDYYSLYHNARYVKILVGLKGQSGNHAYFRFSEENGQASVETYEWQYEETAGYFKTLTIDLGVPTYTRRYFLAQLKSTDYQRYAYGRILRIWMEG